MNEQRSFPQGWYVDPLDQELVRLRWWDGERWAKGTKKRPRRDRGTPVVGTQPPPPTSAGRETDPPFEGTGANAKEPLDKGSDSIAKAPAGWYPDSISGAGLRWWDGTAWTEHVTESHSEPSPQDGPTSPGATAPADTEPTPPNPVGMAAAISGAVLLVVAMFLPLVDPGNSLPVAENSLIQQKLGIAVAFMVGATAIAAAVVRAYQTGEANQTPLILGALALAGVIAVGVDHSLYQLTVTSSFGSSPLAGKDFTGSPGIAVYVAGAGAGMAAIGGWIMQYGGPTRTTPRNRADEAHKPCPDCAETVLAAAKVCRYCGYRFE